MKAKRILSLLAVMLVATMLLSLVGCSELLGLVDPDADESSDVSYIMVGDDDNTDNDGGEDAGDAGSDDKGSNNSGDKGGSSGSSSSGKKVPEFNSTKSTAMERVLKQVPSDLKGTKIKMFVWWTPGTDDKNKAAAFNKATGIKVSYENAVMDKYQTNLSAKIMGGNPPAIAAIVNEWYPQPITRGLMQPITNTGWKFTDKVYATSLMEQFSYNGKKYGIALKTGTNCTFQVMFYNKNILKQSGVTKDPYQLWKAGNWNWDTCLNIAKKCTKKLAGDKQQYGLSLVGQYYWMLSAGQDFVKVGKDGKLTNNIKNSAVRNAWNYSWDIIWKEGVVDTSFKGQDPFYQNTVAMLGGGSYLMQAEASRKNYVPQNMKAGTWGVVPFPSPKGQTPVAAADGTVWGFPTKVKGDQLQAAAWYLCYYLDDMYNTNMKKSFYSNNQSWEVMKWMWNQKIQSYNSVGILTYGGEHTAYTIQYSLIDETKTDKSKMTAQLDSWYATLGANIKKIEAEAAK